MRSMLFWMGTAPLLWCPAWAAAGGEVLTLERASEMLIARNLAVVEADRRVELAAAAREVAGLAPHPSLRLGIEQLPVWTPVPGFLPNFGRTNPDGGANPTYTMEVERLFERGGKRELRTARATAALEAAEARRLDTLREELLALRRAFTAGLLARANRQLAEETDGWYADTERLMSVRLRAGEIAPVDLDRVKAARLPYLQAVLEARQAYQQAAREVARVLGLGSAPAPELSGELYEAHPAPAAEKVRALAGSARPDLLTARAELREAGTARRLAEAGRKRDITGSFGVQRAGQDYAIAAGVTIPIGAAAHRRAEIGQAVAEERVAEAQLRRRRAAVESDVERALAAVAVSRETLGLYEAETLERSRQIRGILTYSYQRGEADLLEVLEAQRSANQILTAYNQARAGYMNALWELEYAAGGRVQ